MSLDMDFDIEIAEKLIGLKSLSLLRYR